ncbi:MAG: SLC13 family permease [Dialister sp.]|nr:SLC13 family permease [Dialister sp.]
MALLSLFSLAGAIFLGFFRKMNTGLVCIGFALLLGKIAGMADRDIIGGFNYSLFLMLLGVTYLFGLAEINGTLKLLTRKITVLAGKHTYMIPVVMYVFATVLSALGPGTIPTTAIMMVFGMTLAVEMKINPAMLAAIIFLGAAGGGMSPLAATGIIGLDLCQGFGLTGIELPLLVNGVLSSTVYAALVYVAFGGYKLKSDVVLKFSDIPAFNKEQIVTLIGIASMVGLVMLFKVNVGLASFTVAMVLSFLRVSDEEQALKKIPWGTLLLICGVGVLMNVIIALGGIDLLSASLASVMNAKTATTILGVTAGVMSWFSSTSGVVMPTLIPTIPHIIEQMSISVNPVEWVTAISMVSNTAGISPLSTGGALALAAYSAEAGAAAGELDRLFIKMFSISAAGVVTLSILAYFGFYRWLL